MTDKMSWVAMGLAAVAVLGLITLGSVQYSEWRCDREASNLRLAGGDYDLFTNTCYVDLPDGTRIDVERYRAINTD